MARLSFMLPIAGFVLAGGKSSRMGEDKASLRLEGHSLLDIACRKLLAITSEVFIVGSRKQFGAEAIEDIFADRGPLGGIHAALALGHAELNLVMAVDLPFVEDKFLGYLAREAKASDAVVTLPRTADGWQPLCAVYRQSFLLPAEKALRAGHNKIDHLFKEISLRIIDEVELRGAGFSPEMFDNLNTPGDATRARQRLQKGVLSSS